MRHCWHWCGFTSGRPPIPSLPSCIAVLVIRYCATTGISRLSSYSYREYIRLICICVLLFLLSYFLSRPDYPDIRAFYGSPSQYNESDCSLQYCSTAVCIIIRLARPRAQGRVLVGACVMSPCLLLVCPSVDPRHQVTHTQQTESTTCSLCSAAVLQCCSAAGPDIAPSFVWLARPRPHRGLEGQRRVTSSLPPILGDYKQYRKV